jgi:hypothetical protein
MEYSFAKTIKFETSSLSPRVLLTDEDTDITLAFSLSQTEEESFQDFMKGE